MNNTLCASSPTLPFNHPIQAFINLNKTCKEQQVGKKQRDLIPPSLFSSPADIVDFLGSTKTKVIHLQGEYASQEKEIREVKEKLATVEMENKTKRENKEQQLSQQFAEYKVSYKKVSIPLLSISYYLYLSFISSPFFPCLFTNTRAEPGTPIPENGESEDGRR